MLILAQLQRSGPNSRSRIRKKCRLDIRRKLPSSFTSRVLESSGVAHASPAQARKAAKWGFPGLPGIPMEAWCCLQAERQRRENHATILRASALRLPDRVASRRIGFGADAAHLVGAQQSAT